MRVVLQVRSGPRKGHRIWIGPEQRVCVGSTEWAEFSVPDDPQVSAEHFVLECDHRLCRIKSVDDDHPIVVNGQEASGRTLLNGDIIRVGDTEFSIEIELSTDEISPSATLVWSRISIPSITVNYHARNCASELVEYRGRASQHSPGSVARMLGARNSMYLIVNATTADSLLDGVDGLPEAALSFVAMLPDDVLESRLLLVSEHDELDRVELLEKLWGHNCVTCFFSGRERPNFFEVLSRSPAWLSHPDILEDRVHGMPGEMARQALRGIKCLMMESERGAEWTIYVDPRPEPTWQEIGLPVAPGTL